MASTRLAARLVFAIALASFLAGASAELAELPPAELPPAELPPATVDSATVDSARHVTCMFCEHVDFQGRCWTLEGRNYPNLVAYGLNDILSSVETGPGCVMTLFEHVNYQGASRAVPSSTKLANVFSGNWNDVASSLSCVCAF
jgi:hypothetical protein